MTREIELTQGKVALIDDEDFDLVNQYKWHAAKHGATLSSLWYAMTRQRVTKDKQRGLSMHRVVMGNPSKIIDHINQDGLDNRKCNLRTCTNAQNSRNGRPIIGTSKYKGVSWNKIQKRWRARIQTEDTRLFLGNFLTEREAVLSYNAAAKKYFGEFAYLNKWEQ